MGMRSIRTMAAPRAKARPAYAPPSEPGILANGPMVSYAPPPPIQTTGSVPMIGMIPQQPDGSEAGTYTANTLPGPVHPAIEAAARAFLAGSAGFDPSRASNGTAALGGFLQGIAGGIAGPANARDAYNAKAQDAANALNTDAQKQKNAHAVELARLRWDMGKGTPAKAVALNETPITDGLAAQLGVPKKFVGLPYGMWTDSPEYKAKTRTPAAAAEAYDYTPWTNYTATDDANVKGIPYLRASDFKSKEGALTLRRAATEGVAVLNDKDAERVGQIDQAKMLVARLNSDLGGLASVDPAARPATWARLTIARAAQTDPRLKSLGTQTFETALNQARALIPPGGGFRWNEAEINRTINNAPKPTDTVASLANWITKVQDMMNDIQSATLRRDRSGMLGMKSKPGMTPAGPPLGSDAAAAAAKYGVPNGH